MKPQYSQHTYFDLHMARHAIICDQLNEQLDKGIGIKVNLSEGGPKEFEATEFRPTPALPECLVNGKWQKCYGYEIVTP